MISLHRYLSASLLLATLLGPSAALANDQPMSAKSLSARQMVPTTTTPQPEPNPDSSPHLNPESPLGKRASIGVAFSGGGARGFAHVGVLKVLERLRIPVDYVAGTSMGSVAGALYASGFSPAEMQQELNAVDWDATLQDLPERKQRAYRRKSIIRNNLYGLEIGVGLDGVSFQSGALAGQKLQLLLNRMTLRSLGVTNFDQLQLPFRAIATDLLTGEAVVMGSGRLTTAIEASMAVPGAFTPIERDGRYLVDGGLVRNLPIDVVRNMGAERVIAIDVGTAPLDDPEALSDLLGVSAQAVLLLSQQNVDAQIKSLQPERDLLLRVDLGDYTSGDFNRSRTLVSLGESAAWKLAGELRQFSVSAAEYAAWQQTQRKPAPAKFEIQTLTLDPGPRVSNEQVLARIKTGAPGVVDFDQLAADVQQLVDLDDYAKVTATPWRTDGGHQGMTIKGEPKAWGPSYLKFGLELADDFEGGSEYTLIAQLNRLQLNRLGGEWLARISIGQRRELYTELFQPLDYNGWFFVQPWIRGATDLVDVFQEEERVAEFNINSVETAVFAGIQFGTWGELKAGPVIGRIRGRARSGGAGRFPPFRIRQGGFALAFNIDTLDNYDFPTDGIDSSFNAYVSSDLLNSEEDYERLNWRFNGYHRYGRWTGFSGLEIGLNLGDNVPVVDEFSLGGFLRLSGLRNHQLRDRAITFGRVGLYRRVSDISQAIGGGGLYVGGSLEAGQVWRDEDAFEANRLLLAGSVFAGVDSFVGPLFLSLGYTENGNWAGYLVLGKTF